MSGDPPQGAEDGSDGEDTPSLPPWLRQLMMAASALRELAQAQWQLMCSEWRLARSAAKAVLALVLLMALFSLALGMSLLALAATALAYWLGSWILALGILSAILALCLMVSFFLFRRCLGWMSLPETRAQWRLLKQDLGRSTRPSTQAPARREQGETDQHDTATSPE